MMRKYGQMTLLLAVLTMTALPVKAVDYNIRITATLQEPVCTVTSAMGNGTLEVNFNTLATLQVNTDVAKQDLNVRVLCDMRAAPGKVLRMSIRPSGQGTITVNGRAVLNTTLNGLGIELTGPGGDYLTPGSTIWHNVPGVDISQVTPSGTLAMTATLVSSDAGALRGGDFSASATIIMQYR